MVKNIAGFLISEPINRYELKTSQSSEKNETTTTTKSPLCVILWPLRRTWLIDYVKKKKKKKKTKTRFGRATTRLLVSGLEPIESVQLDWYETALQHLFFVPWSLSSGNSVRYTAARHYTSSSSLLNIKRPTGAVATSAVPAGSVGCTLSLSLFFFPFGISE